MMIATVSHHNQRALTESRGKAVHVANCPLLSVWYDCPVEQILWIPGACLSYGGGRTMAVPPGKPDGLAVGKSADDTQPTQVLELTATVWDGAPHKAASPEWQLKEFFSLSDTEEVILKKQIASKLGILYGNANQDKPFAEDFGGIKAYAVDGITLHMKPSAPSCSIATSPALPVRKPSQTLATCPWWSRDA